MKYRVQADADGEFFRIVCSKDGQNWQPPPTYQKTVYSDRLVAETVVRRLRAIEPDHKWLPVED